MRAIAVSLTMLATIALAAAARAASTFEISGGGNGHGIGMSQYGAYGYALHGEDYRFILAHYYRGTALGQTNPLQIVRVLLATGGASFSGATYAPHKKLNPNETYSVQALADGSLVLYDQHGKKVGRFKAPLSVGGTGPLDLVGHGRYRGWLEFRLSASGSSVQTVNALHLEDYVRGVISYEMPAGWAAEALKVQAVAARTYAITSRVSGNGYQLYPDTRSQMYGGVAAETASTDAAVAVTRGQIVTYRGAPAITYFSSSSGGYTENVENVWLGSTPQPWLRGVADPYDGVGGNPYHRWSTSMTMADAAAKLGALVKGSFVGINVTKRGVSPRVVSAQVVGTGGSTNVSGPQLQGIFGLPSTYMLFTAISSGSGTTPPAGLPGAQARRLLFRAPLAAAETAFEATPPRGIHGRVFPARRGALAAVQLRTRRGWRTVERVRIGKGGVFSARLSRAGRYRVVYRSADGPVIAIG